MKRLSMRRTFLVFSYIILSSCGSGGSDAVTPELETSCSVTEIESELDQILSLADSEVDFSFVIERQDERRYVFNRGNSTLQTSYESASTSKLVSAVVILRLVELGYLMLTDHPQDYISSWPIESIDPLYSINLSHLLSFTSGLENTPLCVNIGLSNFETCINNMAEQNTEGNVIPGESFYYASTHLQVAGLMAYNAMSLSSWQELFTDFKEETGLFSNSTFDLPSSSNPRLAGGMRWQGDDYIEFLSSLSRGEILNSASMALLLSDHTEGVTINYSPVLNSLMEDWHYGFGLWHECESPVFNCETGTRVSSPGAYGAYPYWDQTMNYIGLVARQGELGSFTNGLTIERRVRDTAERWVVCQ